MTNDNTLDARVHPHRPDLADIRLKGLVDAERFVDGPYRRLAVPSAPLRRLARSDAPIDTEILQGELVRVFEETGEGWAWVQLETDGYVGFVSADTLGPVDPAPTHRVTALRTFIYPAADMKLPVIGALSLHAEIAATDERETRGTLFRILANGAGAVVARHLEPVGGAREADFVAVAERFLNVPYLWGGRSSLGLDCSALVQLSLAAAGIAAPRDTDQQEASLGAAVEGGAEGELRRGDLIFWRGHVGILADRDTLLHASGYQMMVVAEPLAGAIERIGKAGNMPTSVRRVG